MSFKDTTTKLQHVLNLFLQPNYDVPSTYLETLFTNINTEVEKGNQEIIQLIQDWLKIALNTWNENFKPCQNVTTFTIKLIGYMSLHEPIFYNLQQNEILTRAIAVFEYQNNNLSASVKMSFTLLLVNLVEHQSGRQWIIQTGAWKKILKYAQINHTMYVSRESKNFLSRLLVRECYNRTLCEEIIKAITEPLVKATDTQTNQNNQNLGNDHLFEQNNLLLTTFQIIYVTLEHALFHDLMNPIPDMFEELADLENRVKVVFTLSISTSFMKIVHQLSKLLAFTKLRSSLRVSDVIEEKIYEQFCFGLYWSAKMLLEKKYILDLVISNKLSIIYWKKLNKLKTITIARQYKFEDQCIALMMLPLCLSIKPYNYVQEKFLLEGYYERIFDITCIPVQKLGYRIRDVMMKNSFPMEYICKSTIDHLLEIIDIIERETAVFAFQAIWHALKGFVPNKLQKKLTCNNTPPPALPKRNYFLDGDPINEKQVLLTALLNGLNVLIEKFKLKWPECLETTYVLTVAQDIINHPGVDYKICILALKMCKLSIQNFMPPNLALLVDFDDDTKIIGPTLFRRLGDTHWEVQDSVFEILNTIACLSENKYPPFQNLLIENQFSQVAVDLIKSESESYVRASALSFISTAVRINELWDKTLKHLKLMELAIDLVYNESEIIVRREAVNLIKELYVHRCWTKTTINGMVHAMTVAAVLDLHWEVKINALEFWRHFIKYHLTYQGMVDGLFPYVTFCKENKKIVTLDEFEIKNRLNKTLDELSRQHCLGVLLVTLKDESDFEVAKTSANIIEEFRSILLKYKIDEPMPEIKLPKDCPVIDSTYVRRTPVITNDTTSNAQGVINAIVDSSDAELLSSITRDSMKMDVVEDEKTCRETLEAICKVNRSEFLSQILTYDLEGYLKQRRDWLYNYTNSFDSILEDIVTANDNKDINVMDCY